MRWRPPVPGQTAGGFESARGRGVEGVGGPEAASSVGASAGVVAPAWFGDPDLLAAFWRYERALMKNDVPELDALFAEGPETVRSEAGSALVGHEAIAEFRAARPPVPNRSLRRVHLREIGDDAAVIIAETIRDDRGTGSQTQVWRRVGGVWRVAVAHVSTVPGMQFSALQLTDAEERAIWATPPERRPLRPSLARPESPGGLTGGAAASGESAPGEGVVAEGASSERATGAGAVGESAPGGGAVAGGDSSEHATGAGAVGEGAVGEGAPGEGAPGEGAVAEGASSERATGAGAVGEGAVGVRIEATHAAGVSPGDAGAVDARGEGAGRLGSLVGIRVAVKDLFALAGETIGAGNPRFREGREPERTTAPAVQALLDEGAEITGLAQTDELAFSIAGTNVHYGTPPNPAAPGHISGGSTSGPASAVALGLADLALGTDTAGSIRVPGSYTGLFGLRTTHGAVSREGLIPLAPSFDTVGVLASDLATLRAGARAILSTGGPRSPGSPGSPGGTDRPSAPVPVTRLLIDPALLALADADTRLTFEAGLRALALGSGAEVGQVEGAGAIVPSQLEEWFDAFRVVQQVEAWASNGEFVRANPGALDAAIAERFRVASGLSETEAQDARTVLARATAVLDALVVPGVALALPSTAGPAPALDATPEEIDRVRGATLRLTCLASLSGLPALTLPYGRSGTLPVGLCVIGSRGADLALLDLATPRP